MIMNKVFFNSADRKHNLKSSYSIKIFLQSIFIKEKKKLKRLDYIFCSDNYLQNINKEFLNHNTLTDIITFPFSPTPELIKGEIYISVERVKENANLFKTSYQNEILRVLIHGALHLCGYNDKNDSQKTAMRKKEDFYLNQCKISRETNN